MTQVPSRDVIKISISKNDPHQVLIAKHLRNSGNITSQCMEAISAYWYPIALSEDSDSSDEEVELAFSVAERKLLAQIEYLKDYQRIKRKKLASSKSTVN